ncbi:MAG: AMP-binding protein [Acidimicrobiia bacterium]|nr:AMP-binding protein [Acidimicrobiia bacterium]
MTATLERPSATSDPTELPSLPAVLVHRARTSPTTVALRKKQYGRWKEYDWATYATRSAHIMAGLASLGVGPGDKVAIHSENRPAWVMADLAVQAMGAVSVGVYPTSPPAEVQYALEHSETKVVIVEDEEQFDKAIEVRHQLPELRHIVVVDPRGIRQLDDDQVLTLADLEARGADATIDDLAAATERIDPADAAILVYTSGTTGPPKGAMISHDNLMAAARSTREQFSVADGDEVLSYLPLCHIAERLISVVNALGSGYRVNFGESTDTLLTDLAEVQPTFFVGVPRVWEKMMAAIEIRMADASWAKRTTYRVWKAQGTRLARKRMSDSLNPFDRLWYGLGWLMLYRSLRQKLGLLRVREAVSGAAPVSPQVLEFFWALGVPVREVYGQTENTAQATMTPKGDVRIGWVGTAVPGAEVRLDPDTGEILTRGAGTFIGYYRNPEATAETVDADGWLHTGDVGEMDADGFLRITDRMKDIIITAGGKNISPSEIENKLKVSPYIAEAIVIGDGRKFLTALVGIEADTVGNWATQRRLDYTTYRDLTTKPEVVGLIDGEVAKANADLAQVETIKAFRLLPKELDQEDGEVTATQKVKRRAIEREFAELIDGMYGGG